MYKIKSAIGLLVALVAISSSFLSTWASPTVPAVVLTVPANGVAGVETDQKIEVTFNKPINRSRVNKKTFSLIEKGSGDRVAGTMSYSNKIRKLSFQPKQELSSDTQYIVRINGAEAKKHGLRDFRGNVMKSDYVWSFRTGSNSVTDVISEANSLIVSSTSPVNGSSDILRNANVLATFNNNINSSTVGFTLAKGTTAVAGSVSNFGKNSTFTPTANLEANTTYTATVTTQIQDVAGITLANDYLWSFRTGEELDDSLPTVVTVSPVAGISDAALNSTVTAEFSEAMDPLTLTTTTVSLKQGTTLIPGTVTYSGNTVVFSPSAFLSAGSSYMAVISNQVTDLAANPMASEYVWFFNTRPADVDPNLDRTAPQVSLVGPLNGATAVALSRTVSITFSEAMSPATINATSIVLSQGTTLISGAVTYNGNTGVAVFTPAVNLDINNGYLLTVTTQATDLAGNALAVNKVSRFTTGQNQHTTVALGAAGTFTILAGSTVTSTGFAVVNGDLGLSPGTSVTGFPPAILTGTSHVNNPTSAQAQLDLTTAYNDAAGRTLAPVVVAGNIGGQTFGPGLYKSTSTLAISSGNVTLDAQGDPDAIFIFQIASAFSVTSGRQVFLINGAVPANVFWQVGTSATFETTSVFKGIILADQSISFDTGATLDGRALARIGAVSLDANTITRP
jgi:hypothetical protein